MILALAAAAAMSSLSVDGVLLNSNVRAAVSSHGPPSVVTTDVGQIWTWHDKSGKALRVTTDDDGVIQLIDEVRAHSAMKITLGTRNVSLNDGAGTMRNAVSSAGAVFAGSSHGSLPDSQTPAAFWMYHLGRERSLALAFDSSDVLRETFLGDDSAFARTGLLGAAPSSYAAPVLKRLGEADYQQRTSGTAFIRIAVAPDGTVRNASVFISSGDAILDRIATTIASGSTFSPATRDGKPVDGVYFRREDFIVAR